MSSSEQGGKRKSIRYAIDVRAKIRVDGKEFTVRTSDISEGGIGLISPFAIPEGTVAEVEMIFPAVQESFRAEVRLKSVNGFRYGFRWVALSDACREQLKKYKRRWGIVAK